MTVPPGPPTPDAAKLTRTVKGDGVAYEGHKRSYRVLPSSTSQKLHLQIWVEGLATPLVDTLSAISSKSRHDFAKRLAGDLQPELATLYEQDLAQIVQVELDARSKQANDAEEPPATGVGDPDPWSTPVDGAALLSELTNFIQRFVVLPRYAADAIAAFVAATYMARAFDVAPILFVWSPTKRCGKTRLKDVLTLLVHRPFDTVSASPAALFRIIEAAEPTVLMDESEFLSGHTDRAQALREILNVGYSRGARVPRCVGDNHEIRWFSVFGFKVVLAIGHLWDSLEDRTIPVEMRRSLAGERVERFRRRQVAPKAESLRKQLARWSQDHYSEMEAAKPTLPDFLDDRAQDLWEPLFAVGLVAGGDWYKRLVDASRMLLRGRADDFSEEMQLLTDLRRVWRASKEARLPTEELLTQLRNMEDSFWADLTAKRMAQLLKPFGIHPRSYRISLRVVHGYERAHFQDAFTRYLSTDPQQAQQCPDSATISPVEKGNTGGGVAESNSLDNRHADSTVADVAVAGTEGQGGNGMVLQSEAGEGRRL